MPEGHRLRRSQMRRPRHHGGHVLARAFDEYERQPPAILVDRAGGLPEPRPQVRHHEVVARAARVQTGAEVAEPVGHAAFDRRVHVFVGVIEREPPLDDRGADVLERRRQPIGVSAVE